MESKRVTPTSKPLVNLMVAIIALLSKPQNPINAMRTALNCIVELPKDRHGNILIALDTPDLKIWRDKLERFNFRNLAGPIIIPTSPHVIGAILAQLKTGADANFSGNASTDVVRSLVGGNNIFAANDAKTHSAHKEPFKTFLGNPTENVCKIAPLIKAWLSYQSDTSRIIDDSALESLSASIMASFLLSPQSGTNVELIAAIKNVKSHFVKKATFKEIGMMKYFNGYNAAHRTLCNEINRLIDAGEESYPFTLKKNGMTYSEVISHIISLMMVGFDNLQSSLMSLLVRLHQHPQYKNDLLCEIQQVGNHDFINFDISSLSANHANSFSQLFFLECMRLTPPVWLQARKNKHEQEIQYFNANGKKDTFTLFTSSLVMIPNFELLHRIVAGHDFLPLRPLESRPFNPFSTGLNACPGRNIAYAAAGVLIAEILKSEKGFTLSKTPLYDFQVTLKWKRVEIKPNEMDEASYQRYLQHCNKRNNIVKASSHFGFIVMLAVLNETHDLLTAFTIGSFATLLSIWHNLSDSQRNTPRQSFFSNYVGHREERSVQPTVTIKSLNSKNQI